MAHICKVPRCVARLNQPAADSGMLRAVSRNGFRCLDASLRSRFHRPYSSAAPAPSTTDFDTLSAEMLARPEQITPDILSPTPSYLLNLALSDHLPFPPFSSSSLSPSDLRGADLPDANFLIHFPLARPASRLCLDGADPYHWPGPPWDRRMWGGGSVEWGSTGGGGGRLEMRCQDVECRERIEDVSLKPGTPAASSPGTRRTSSLGGGKLLVQVLRRYGERGFADGNQSITERRVLVFLKGRKDFTEPLAQQGDAEGEQRVVRTPYAPDFSITLTPTPTLLFQYSALSYSAHHIHLNPQYCREEEGHRDLLVHGPLLLTLMLSVLKSRLSLEGGERIRRIDYRNLAPLYVGEQLRVCVRRNRNGGADDKWDVWVENQRGSLSVKGSAVVQIN